MKTTTRIITALFSVLLFCLSAMAEEYSVLVIPDSCLVSNQKNLVESVDIEELLARKFIDKLEISGKDYAPTLRILKISIKNNPTFNKNSCDRLENAKILSASYGVPRVLLISSRIENKNERKKFQNRVDLPIISQQNTNTRIVTRLTMYNTKTNEVIWSDVYYKNVDDLACSNVQIVNSYYDELIPKALATIKGTKETRAVIVHEQGINEVNKGVGVNNKNIALNNVTKDKTKVSTNNKVQKEKITTKEPVKTEPKEQHITKQSIASTPSLTPDLRMKEDLSSKTVIPKKENKITRFKNNLCNKYESYKQEREIAALEKLSQPKEGVNGVNKGVNKGVNEKKVKSEKTLITKTESVKKEIKAEQKKVAETKPVKKEVKSDPKEKFSLAQWFKGVNKGVNEGVNKKVKPEKTLITKTESVKKEIKQEQKKVTEPKTVAKKEVKQETKKIAETKPAETKPVQKIIQPEPEEELNLVQWFKERKAGVNKEVNGVNGVNKKEAKAEKTLITKTEPVKKEIKAEQKKVAEPKTVAKKEVKQEQKKIAETKPAKKEIKSEPKEKFSLAQWFKGVNKKETTPEKVVNTKTESVKKEIKSEQKKITEPKTVAKKEVKQETKKIVETKPAKKEIKPAEEKFSAKIKTKYNDLKAKYDEGKTNKIKTSEENVKYTTVILQDNDNTSSATRYINTRPRYNSINYSPQFDNSVNDI